jgi:hypothetical protein
MWCTAGDGHRFMLAVGSSVKCIRLIAGVYSFTAMLPLTRMWQVLQTEEDLPTFTDKGTRERALPMMGRPTKGTTGAARRLVMRATEEQYRWVQERAEAKGIGISDELRTLLISSGLPQ